MLKQIQQKIGIVSLVAALTIAVGGHALAADSSTSKSTSKTSSSKSKTDKPATANLSIGLTQSYSADAKIQTGMIVQLKPKDDTTVIPLQKGDVKKMLGVVVPNGNATIVLTTDNPKTQQVLVGPSGKMSVLVSNQNGPIKDGDYISTSALDGIAMKASDTQPLALGTALESFDGKKGLVKTLKVKNSLKQDVNVSVGRIIVDVGVTHNPSFHKQDNDFVPGFVAKVVFQVTSKNVSAARIYLAMVILLGIIFVTANMLFGGVRGAMVAVGRNPLSKKSIIISLIQNTIAATLIFVGGVAGVFFLLKL